jgi:hypothetical protein
MTAAWQGLTNQNKEIKSLSFAQQTRRLTDVLFQDGGGEALPHCQPSQSHSHESREDFKRIFIK